MGSAVLGLIHIDTATLGVPDSIWPSARVRFSVRTHGLDCPWVRGLVCSARRGAMAKVTEACDLTRKLAHDDRAKDGPGLRFREPAARSRQFAAEAGLTAYALMAAAAAAVGTSPARSRNPVAAGRRLCHRRPRGGESRGRRLRVRRSGWESRDLSLPPHHSVCRWPGVRPHATDRQDPGGGLEELGGPKTCEARASRHGLKKHRQAVHGQHEKNFGTGCQSTIPAIQQWTIRFLLFTTIIVA